MKANNFSQYGKETWIKLCVVAIVFLLLVQFTLRPYIRMWWKDLETVKITSATLSVRDIGEGKPVIVIISGMACLKDGYWDLQKRLAKHTRVIAYDRPGLGESDSNSDPRTLDVIDRDLGELLRAMDVPPPYILIGHSLGGHIIRYYANNHPKEVAGLVFIDSPHEDWFNYIRSRWSAEQVNDYFKMWSRDNPSFTGVAQEEMLAYERNCDLVRGIDIAQDMPVLMFTGKNSGHFRSDQVGSKLDQQHWAQMQASLISNVEDAKHIIDWETGHMLHHDKPEKVAKEITKFLNKVRDGLEKATE